MGTSHGLSEYYPVSPLVLSASTAAPGSCFTISGRGFPADQKTDLRFNGLSLAEADISPDGTFAFNMATNGAPEGYYIVTTDIFPNYSISLRLDAAAPLLPCEDNATQVDLSQVLTFNQRLTIPLLSK